MEKLRLTIAEQRKARRNGIMYKQLLLTEGGGIISKSQKSPQQGEATVLIGIGGTGLDALKTLKKAVYQHLEQDNPGEDIPKYEKIKFLAIDTDGSNFKSISSDASDLQPNELFSINDPNLARHLEEVEHLRQDPSLNWMSAGQLTMKGADGAGGIRQVGRYCLFKRANDLKTRIHQLISEVKTEAGATQVYIHIFAGISGGTGSGCFLDTCYIAREAMENSPGNVLGYFFLPDIQLNRKGVEGNEPIITYNKENGYAAFRELDYLMSLKSSGEYFDQSYPGFHIHTQKPPVDLCHLISGTDASGKLVKNAYKYAMNVVSDQVLSYMTKVIMPTGKTAGEDDGGLTTAGHIANIGKALAMIKPKYGAERYYHILGASSAELPLTHIGTYLATQTYLKMRPALDHHSSKLICDNFSKMMGYDLDGVSELLKVGTSPAPMLSIDTLPMPSVLQDTVDTWSNVDPEIAGPIYVWQQQYRGKFQENLRAQTTHMDDYDAARLAQITNPTFAVNLFNNLISRVAKNPEKYGPLVAAELLSSEAQTDLGNVMDGIEEKAKTQKGQCQINIRNRIQDICDAADRYNRAHIGKKGKFEDYLNCLAAYFQNQYTIELCDNVMSMVNSFKMIIREMYANYFGPLKEMLARLDQTFDANLDYLNNPDNFKNESYCWRIFELSSVKANLDATVLKPQTPELEHNSFLNYLVEHYTEWKDRDDYRIGLCVNDYMQGHFAETLNTAIDQFLKDTFGVAAPAALAAKVQTEIIDKVNEKAAPLFWVSGSYTMDSSNTFSHNVMTIPSVSGSIKTAAANAQGASTNWVVRPSSVNDRITCVNFASGVPLYAYEGVYSMKSIYDAATSKGLHLHEADVNWRETLPTPIPYRWNPSATPHGEEKAALYQEAVDKRIIDIKSQSDPDIYMVRILADTTDLVAEYTRDKYYFNGVFQASVLKQDIAALQAKREALFLPELDEKTGYQLLNDGYVNATAGPDQDFRERVRKDYFIRFGGLQAIAKESLKQLNRVDDKLAEMEFWMNEVGLANAKSKRFLRLFVTGQLTDDNSGTIKLIYTYQGSTQNEVLCNPNMEYAASHPLYRAYVNLNAMESDRKGKQILEYLDTKLDETFEKLTTNQTSDWVKRNRMLAEAYSHAKVDAISEASTMLPEHDELVDFYKRLGEQAAELSKLMKSDDIQDTTGGTTGTTSAVAATTTTTTVDTWTCPECGKVCKSNWKCCPVCDTERPANVGGQPAIPEFWDCPECGKKGLKIKFKMCPVCDTPNPFADLLKSAAPVAPTSWDCPECGKKGLKLKFKMCPVCDTPRPAELDQFV
jgi:hypothetical protein